MLTLTLQVKTPITIGFVRQSWISKHIMDSWDIFWGSSLACFLLGAYAVGSIYVYNTEEDYMKYKNT